MANKKSLSSSLVVKLIERRIYFIRAQKVMLDSDLAELYDVPSSRLNEAMSKIGRGGRRSAPYAFTEQGVAMLSSVLNSDRAVLVNVAIMRAFVKVREIMATHKDLAHKIEALERKYSDHDHRIQVVFKAIKNLLEPPLAPKRRIGFHGASI
jgi:hypothetical protein